MGEHEIRTRQDAERAEVMLADPDGMKADGLGVDGLIQDLRDELMRTSGIVLVVIVAQREIAEVHDLQSWATADQPRGA